MEGQISSGLLTRAAEAVSEKGALQMLPQFGGWSPSLPNPFGHSQGTPANIEEMYRNYSLGGTRGNQYEIARPVVRPSFARSQDGAVRELGTWATPVHHQQRQEWLCKDSNSLKLGPSSYSEEIGVTDQVAPDAAPVPFIDFLGVGAA